MASDRKTLVINMFAGPGAGKTTCAWEVASELKKHGFVTEYVPEYAKELVWDGNMEMLDGSPEHQTEILAQQEHRLKRLVGKVDFIVTDSPILLNPLYLKEPSAAARKSYTDDVYQRFKGYNNFCVFIKRGTSFESEGRIHDAQQSQEIDQQVIGLLEEYDIYFGRYSYENIHFIVPNCIKTFQRLNPPERSERIASSPETSEKERSFSGKEEKSWVSLEDYAEGRAAKPSGIGHVSVDELNEEDLEL